MQGTFVSAGLSIDHTPDGAIDAGEVVVQGSLVTIAKVPIAATVLGALAASGVFDVVQAAVTFAIGGPVYWDADGDPVGGTAGTGAATTVATANRFMGYALEVTEAIDTTVRMILRSIEDSAAETITIDQLGDVGAVAYTAGKIIVASGTAFAEVAMGGDATLAANGALTLAVGNLPTTEAIVDPGDGEYIAVTNSGSCPLVSEGAETRKVADPTFAGQILNLCFKTDGGAITITADSPINQTGNNMMLFEDVGDCLTLIGSDDGADIEWRVLANDGITLSTA